MIEICREAPQDIVFSVECGTVDQAERSIQHLRGILNAESSQGTSCVASLTK
jgi:hypothetical protein